MLDYLDEKVLKNITQEEFDKMINTQEKWDKGYIFHLLGYNLSNIKIKNKDFRCIIVYDCLLNNITFEDCNLKNIDIKNSKIINTNFINCNLCGGNFCECEFINTDLSTCNIKKCNFSYSTFDNTIMPDYPMACPEKGSFIGYKKVYNINNYSEYYILKLKIPEDARRSSAVSNKCRCDKAKVLEIQNLDGSIAKNIIKVRSIYDCHFIYELGKTAEEPKFDECRWHECDAGIHFFMNREAAVDY